ncbi:hypothetical protein ACFCZ3_19815 [Cellulosimicrobium cellulans]|uniref:hypothetical protein n=1 Tax=Cellulosimicrobium cellulans TaxID=1710 RepID=UPI0035D9395F
MPTPTPTSRTRPCEVCDRPRRPNGTRVSDFPGTIQSATARECVTCYARRIATGLSFDEFHAREVEDHPSSVGLGGLDSFDHYVTAGEPLTDDQVAKVARLVAHDPELMWMLGLTERTDHAPVPA